MLTRRNTRSTKPLALFSKEGGPAGPGDLSEPQTNDYLIHMHFVYYSYSWLYADTAKIYFSPKAGKNSKFWRKINNQLFC